MTTTTRTDSKVGATCGNTGLGSPVGSQGLNSAPSRTEFEAAALPPLPPTEWCGLVHQGGPYEPEWTSHQDGYTAEDMENYARTAIAAAMGWPAVPQEPCFCDRTGLGDPGVSCGDCPNRDYGAAPTPKEQAGWRPIESAPTDRDVLLYSPRFSLPNVGNWRDFKGINHPGYTHWTPLPPYPTPKEPTP